MEDSGVFAVIAENRGGKAKCSANLLVEERKQVGRKGPGPPSFLSTMQGSVVKAGQLVRFDVKISANKPLDVYWLKVYLNNCGSFQEIHVFKNDLNFILL